MSQCPSRGAIRRVRSQLRFLGQQKLGHRRVRGVKTQLPIKPKRAGLDGFVVMVTHLIGVDREASDREQLAKQPQQARVNPGRLAFAKRVVEIEADLHVLKQGQAFDVADGDAVLEEHPSVIGAQRQAMLWRYSANERLNSAAEIGANYVSWIAIGESVQFAIAHRRCLAREIEQVLAFVAA